MPNTQDCLTKQELIDSGAQIVENNNGTISVFVISNGDELIPKFLNKSCCEFLNSNLTGSTKYFFDKTDQSCRWASKDSCDILNNYKVIINPNGDDGVLFDLNTNENCYLDVKFKYLVKFDSKDLIKLIGPPNNIANALEMFNLTFVIDTVDSVTNKLTTVYETSLFNIGVGKLNTYLNNSSDTGLLICKGDITNSCDPLLVKGPLNNNNMLLSNLVTILSAQGNFKINDYTKFIPENSFNSDWLEFSTRIAKDITYLGNSVLDAIINKKITISIKVNNSIVNSSLLFDNIKLNRNCDSIESNNILISKSPGFNLNRVVDNKKSWVSNTELTNRIFDLPYRETDYTINNNKLLINSKEIDLTISLKKAIETDVFNYFKNNSCLFSGTCSLDAYVDLDYVDYDYVIVYSGATSCGDNCIDLNDLLTTNFSGITTHEDFEQVIITELIDAKNRKTLSAYPTVKLFYDRYLNSEKYCNSFNNKFDYVGVDKFVSLVGTYWVDLIEQVIPSTTIWGSTYVYSNTIFDTQKYRYRTHSLFTCKEPICFPFSAIGVNTSVEVLQTTISTDISGNTITSNIETCNGAWIVQRNCGSEFIGTVDIIGSKINKLDSTCGIDGNNVILNNVELIVNVSKIKTVPNEYYVKPNYVLNDYLVIYSSNTIMYEAIASNGDAPYTFNWTIDNSSGFYITGATDSNIVVVVVPIYVDINTAISPLHLVVEDSNNNQAIFDNVS